MREDHFHLRKRRERIATSDTSLAASGEESSDNILSIVYHGRSKRTGSV